MEEHFEQIGERLKNAREDAGLEVDEVVLRTHMPRSAIEALEADDFSHFTSPVYAKSFLAQYSGFLNVDATPWLEALKPSAFIEGDPQLPLLEKSGMMAIHSSSAENTRGGWTSMLWLLAISCGIVFGAVQVFVYYESRFEVDSSHQSGGLVPGNPQPAENAPKPEVSPPSEPEVSQPNAEADALHGAPRAIIVR